MSSGDVAFEHAVVPMALVAPEGRFLAVNQALCDLLDRPRDHLVASGLQDITITEDAERSVTVRRRRLIRSDGGVVAALITSTLIEATPHSLEHYLVQVQALSARAEVRSGDQELHDPVTGLPNRALFVDELRSALARASRRGMGLAVFVLDLDHFALVNERLGSEVGDRVLAHVSTRLQTHLRLSDTVGRLGAGGWLPGDEFAVVCEDLDDERHAVVLAERFGSVIGGPLVVDDHELSVTASIGVAVAMTRETSPEAVLRSAEAAMWRAKQRGGAGYELFDEAARDRAVSRLATEDALSRAIERDELRVHYQPILRLDRSSVMGVEALLRWERPESGLMAPAEFIPLAEDSSLIVSIGAWVMREAVRQTHEWRQRFPQLGLTVSVNLSGRQLGDPDLHEVVSGVLRDSEIEPSALSLEITETVLIEDGDRAWAALQPLKELGVRLEVDDFGIGYSSLSYLRLFPLDGLKLDRSFVADLGSDDKVEAIVSAVIGLAHALALTVVAEGVETPVELGILEQFGCDFAQGYHWSRPLPPPQFEQWLLDHVPGRAP
ncbi:MAG: EAL domain-containing protein [Actinomycetota bacterium]|nr:EAL domain-containing protein [Actinomycetota bacterium]